MKKVTSYVSLPLGCSEPSLYLELRERVVGGGGGLQLGGLGLGLQQGEHLHGLLRPAVPHPRYNVCCEQ